MNEPSLSFKKDTQLGVPVERHLVTGDLMIQVTCIINMSWS